MNESAWANIWVLVAFVVFVAGMLYLGVHRMIATALDARSARIANELEEARRFKEEAQKLVAEFKRKQREAEEEAQSIVTAAKAEAERLATEAKVKLDEFVARRTKLAEDKISQAEKQALEDVKAVAADAATRAAGVLLGNASHGAVADKLISGAISEVQSKLN